MNKFSIIIFICFLVACNPFREDRVLSYQDELNNLVSKLDNYDSGTYSRDEIDEFIINDIRKLGINLVVINKGKSNSDYSGFAESNDSLIILTNTSGIIIESEKNIIYDFCKEPRNFGNQDIIGASYKITQLNERWYYSEKRGFD